MVQPALPPRPQPRGRIRVHRSRRRPHPPQRPRRIPTRLEPRLDRLTGMGISTNAYLMYGYPLGDPSEGWTGLKDPPSWLDDADDLESEVESRLLKSVGFMETDYMVPGYFDRKKAALAPIGVTIEQYCS